MSFYMMQFYSCKLIKLPLRGVWAHAEWQQTQIMSKEVRCPCDAAENGCMDDFSRAFFVPTGSDISDFIHNIESQDIKVEMMKQSDYMAAAPHSAAINVTRSSKVTLILHRLNLITDIRLDETGAPPPTFNVSRCSCCSQSALCLRAAGSSNWELSV